MAAKPLLIPIAPPHIEIPSALVDAFGDVVKLRDAFAPTERLYQKLRAQLVALTDEAEADFTTTAKGERWDLAISARKMDNSPDIPAVRKRLGAALFLSIAQVTKKALEGFLLKHEIEELCVTTQTGGRSYDPTPVKPAA